MGIVLCWLKAACALMAIGIGLLLIVRALMARDWLVAGVLVVLYVVISFVAALYREMRRNRPSDPPIKD